MSEPAPQAGQYSVIVRPDGKKWSWTIQRVPELGIKIHESGYFTEKSAKLAGEKALYDLLQNLEEH